MERPPAPESASDVATSGDPPPLELMSLLPDLRSIIIRALTRDAARTLAATSSASLQDVLESRSDVRTFTVHRTLARSMAQLRFRTPAQRKAAATVSHQGFQVAVLFPLHAAPLICAVQQQPGAPTLANPALLWFSFNLISSATSVEVAASTHDPLPTLSFPPGMLNLAAVRVSGFQLPANWLPPSSCSSVRELRVLDSEFQQSLPKGMRVLERLELKRCSGLGGDWLSQSSRGVRELVALSCSIQGVPEGMHRLERFSFYTGGHTMAADWLPESSRQRVRVLEITSGGAQFRGVPARMPAMEAVMLIGCASLPDEWLPPSSRENVRIIFLHFTTTAIPAGMGSLQAVCISHCRLLEGQDWLPASSRERVRALCATRSDIGSVPGGMGALESLTLVECKELSEGWLPASSSQRVQTLDARQSSIARLPANMHALSAVSVQECRSLAADWLPESSTLAMCSVTADTSILQRLPVSVKAQCSTATPHTFPSYRELIRCALHCTLFLCSICQACYYALTLCQPIASELTSQPRSQ